MIGWALSLLQSTIHSRRARHAQAAAEAAATARSEEQSYREGLAMALTEIRNESRANRERMVALDGQVGLLVQILGPEAAQALSTARTVPPVIPYPGPHTHPGGVGG